MTDRAEEQYKWCSHCGGCLNELAKFCRFCRASASSASSTLTFRGADTCSDVNRWLPQFSELMDAIPHGQLKSLLLTADAAQTNEMKQTPAIDSMIGYQLPPSHKVEELLKLVLTRTHDTPIYNRLEGHSRLLLIGLTYDTINNERALIEKEHKAGERCNYCGESILVIAGSCRFCGTDKGAQFSTKPAKMTALDEKFLRIMLIHVAASERLEPISAPYLQELTARYEISESEIAVEEGRLSSSFLPSYEKELPLSSWECELVAYGHDHDRTQYSAVRNLVELSRSCRLHNRPHESQLLLRFAESIISRPETDEFLRDFMLVDFRSEQSLLKSFIDAANEAAG